MEHFQEYLLYQPFLVKTENNPLMYIMTTPNLDATGHRWVGSLAKFNFWLEYQKGQWEYSGRCAELNYHLSWPGGHASNPGWSNLKCLPEAEGEDPAVIEGD